MGRSVDYSAPALGFLTVLTNHETCEVKVGEQVLGFPHFEHADCLGTSRGVVCKNGQSPPGKFATVAPMWAGRRGSAEAREKSLPRVGARRRRGDRPATAQNREEFARRQAESGLTFLKSARYAEALKTSWPSPIRFHRVQSPTRAAAVGALSPGGGAGSGRGAGRRGPPLKDYPNSDSAPMAYVIGGRLTIGRAIGADVDRALAS